MWQIYQHEFATSILNNDLYTEHPYEIGTFFDDIYIQSSLKPAVFLAFCRRARDMNCFRERERTC